MKKSLVWRFAAAMALLSGSCGVAGAAEPMNHPSPEQQAARAQQAAPEQQAATEQPATPPQSTPAAQPAAPEKVSPEQQAAAQKLGRPAAEANSIGMQLVLIPAGEFMMGSPATEDGRENDEQQHRVRITKSFHLGVHEVTQEQYERVMGVNPSRLKGPQHPVDTVSWNSAVEFCSKLSALPEEHAAGRTYRLPTEAEWEYACRAGSTTRYSFGDNPAELGDHAWFKENSSVTTHPVGEKRPNTWSLYDMHGNVGEWCADWFGEYTKSPVDDPAGPPAGSDRVTRGGSWDFAAAGCRTADRDGRPPAVRNFGLGFRVTALPSTSQASPASPASGAQSDSR